MPHCYAFTLTNKSRATNSIFFCLMTELLYLFKYVALLLSNSVTINDIKSLKKIEANAELVVHHETCPFMKKIIYDNNFHSVPTFLS